MVCHEMLLICLHMLVEDFEGKTSHTHPYIASLRTSLTLYSAASTPCPHCSTRSTAKNKIQGSSIVEFSCQIRLKRYLNRTHSGLYSQYWVRLSVLFRIQSQRRGQFEGICTEYWWVAEFVLGIDIQIIQLPSTNDFGHDNVACHDSSR